MHVFNKFIFALIAFLVTFQISSTKCEETGLTESLSTLSYLISWLPKASIPTPPLRLISLLLQLLVKQLERTLLVLDENGPAK